MRNILLVLLATTTLVAQSTTENLRGISVLSQKIAWASGTHGTYLRTTDGGSSWKPAQVPGAESLDFRDVEAFSPDLAYLLAAGTGDQSRIYKTADAGKTWSLQFTNHNPKGFFDCMAFWDRDHGIAVGDPVPDNSGALKFELIATNDGGAHWNPLPASAPPAAIEGESAFAASGTCIAVQGRDNVWFGTGGKVARVFRSTDHGQTWAVAETPIVHGPDSAGIFSIAFRDAKHGVIAGGDYKHPEQSGDNLAFTEDGGRIWKLSDTTPQAYFSAVAFDRKHHRVLATGTALTIEVRNHQASKLSNQNLNALSISRDGKAIAVGPKGVIVDSSQRVSR
jgi:photosystem II stability/assembly factor-like uncharacterized protein